MVSWVGLEIMMFLFRIGQHSINTFNRRVEQLGRDKFPQFEQYGKMTFFIPVDSAFRVRWCECDNIHRRISSEILDMAQYFLPVDFDKYIVLDQDLLPFPIQIFTGLAFLYQFSYGPGHRGHSMKYASG